MRIFQTLVIRLLSESNRLRLPGPSVLPIAGAVVGLYSGLAAGLFANLIALVSGLSAGFPRLVDALQAGSKTRGELAQALAEGKWHFEYLIVGIPVGLVALGLARVISPGGPRDEVKRRLEVLALLVLGGLSLYYPLVALASVNSVLGHAHHVGQSLARLPPWLVVLAPTLGGVVVGRLLRDKPETHGHGVPEVMLAVERGGRLPAQDGLLKLVASAVTIGSGGSAGREGPIVYGGAAFGSAVARTLGFSRRELVILLASGAGAGISASFNAPVAGALFAMEILLREFQLRVFSPIILASVTATMVGRGVMGSASMLERVSYSMVSGWEILAYAALGLVCGGLAFLFLRALHGVEELFSGKLPGTLSAFLGRRSLSTRAGLGGLIVGLLALVHPLAWGTGHEFVNDAAVRGLSLGLLAAGCLLKLGATAITLGSGGSGGTFFPVMVIGAMAGGAVGEVLHAAFPSITATSGAYAMVGMGGAVAAMTRGPLTGMMMIYELSGNYAIILPLMVTCTIASSLCHALVAARAAYAEPGKVALAVRLTPVARFVEWTEPLPLDASGAMVRERLLASRAAAVPVRSPGGALCGVVAVSALGRHWQVGEGEAEATAERLAQRGPSLSAESTVGDALEAMDAQDVDVLAVEAPDRVGVVTRADLKRFLRNERPFAPTEVRR